jgi:hypothetical protein
MATVYKIHPAIGVARVGNSPDEFFIGPNFNSLETGVSPTSKMSNHQGPTV